MKNYKITVNGNTYDVSVEDAGGSPEVKSVQAAAPAPKAAPAPAPAPKAAAPAPKAEAPKASSGAGTDVLAPLGGTVLSIPVKEGDKVTAGQTVLVFEAMKMENELAAIVDGTIKKIYVAVGDVIDTGKVVVTIA